MRCITAVIPIVLWSCATPIEDVSLDWRLVDYPEESRIELLYLNDTGKALCLLATSWPNEAGKLNQMSALVFLVVGAQRFPIEDFNTGYCPTGCVRRVASGEAISGSIPYKDFDLPERLRYEPKSLVFPATAYACR